MFCRNCGKELSDEAKYCSSCGNEISNDNLNSGISFLNNSNTFSTENIVNKDLKKEVNKLEQQSTEKKCYYIDSALKFIFSRSATIFDIFIILNLFFWGIKWFNIISIIWFCINILILVFVSIYKIIFILKYKQKHLKTESIKEL